MSASLQKVIGVCGRDVRSIYGVLNQANISHVLSNYPQATIGPTQDKKIEGDPDFKLHQASVSSMDNAKRICRASVMNQESEGKTQKDFEAQLSDKERELIGQFTRFPRMFDLLCP
uniref:ATP synthase-coupling factor 6, mitochondrial n=1 Tax=Syphacia muris TaxID=451379 RepID=A0A0N5A945_9BILA